MNSKVDTYLSKTEKWQEELHTLRQILLDCGLAEELKWGVPCYMFKNSNIALMGAFKEYCTLSFLKGTLLKDTHNILKKPGENTQSARTIAFTNIKEVIELTSTLKAYIFEAIEIEKEGLKVDFKKISEFEIPEELQSKFNENLSLKKAFNALTPGRQKAYLIYFSGAKQAKTRISRIEKYTQQILDGKGLNDCTCGLSRKLPYCDGSHKYLSQDN